MNGADRRCSFAARIGEPEDRDLLLIEIREFNSINTEFPGPIHVDIFCALPKIIFIVEIFPGP
jgi:hypothetical protein